MGAEPGGQEQIAKIEAQKPQVVDTLKAHQIPIETWGTGKAKTVDHLVKEVVEGEAVLTTTETGELVRQISVIGMDVFHKGADGKTYKLVEDKQVFKDGRERRRELPTSMGEKVQPGEDLDEAAVRAVREELGVEGDLPVEHVNTTRKVRESNSYPGLNGEYVIHDYRSWLTSEQFKQEGYIERQADKDVYFVWREIQDTPLDEAS
jgi:hypothetical protein